MKYPINVEIQLIQEDFIEVEMIENIIDSKDLKAECLKAFYIQTACCFAICVILSFQKFIAKESLWLVLLFFILFLSNFCYRYFYGIKNELNMNLKHLILSNEKGNEFFTSEYGMVNFYEDRCEYLTNENRRYFDNNSILYIKQTKRLFIFVMKNSKEKGMRGFMYMIIPKRCLDESKTEIVKNHCKQIIEKNGISSWIESTIFD